MATVRASIPHEERTAQEPREPSLEPVILSRIEAVNSNIRLLRLSAANPAHTLRVNTLATPHHFLNISLSKFLPGQWLDVFLPGLTKAGGFTITSTPREGRPTPERPAYFELAIQNSSNPPAKWLWKPEGEILNSKIVVRAGGSFVWPPPTLDVSTIEQVVLVAGGVGINPLMSIFLHLLQQDRPPSSIRFIYTTKVDDGPIDGAHILFLQRTMGLISQAKNCHAQLDLFITGVSSDALSKSKGLPSRAKAGRITGADLDAALGEDIKGRESTVCYICGPPRMTDELVGYMSKQKGMDSSRVLCEKWW